MDLNALIICTILFIHIGICVKFATIATDKGHSGLAYGLLCFFFTIIGYCLVAALPDLKMQEKLNDITRKLDNIHSQVYQRQSVPPATPNATDRADADK